MVNVPVLSEQMTEVQPKVSTEGRDLQSIKCLTFCSPVDPTYMWIRYLVNIKFAAIYVAFKLCFILRLLSPFSVLYFSFL